MRKLLIFLLFMTQMAAAQPSVVAHLRTEKVYLLWDANTETYLAGYRMYWGQLSGQYSYKADIPQTGNFIITSYSVVGLTPGVWFFAVTAYNTAGLESGYSNEVSATILPPPGSLVTPRIDLLSSSNITASSATVSWVTIPECSGVLLYGPNVFDFKFSVTANNLATSDHQATTYPLVSRTHYFYKVRSVCNGETVESEIRSFNTK